MHIDKFNVETNHKKKQANNLEGHAARCCGVTKIKNLI